MNKLSTLLVGLAVLSQPILADSDQPLFGCSMQPAGTCTIEVDIEYSHDELRNQIGLFDSNCNLIGFEDNMTAPNSFDSQLHHTVNIVNLTYPTRGTETGQVTRAGEFRFECKLPSGGSWIRSAGV